MPAFAEPLALSFHSQERAKTSESEHRHQWDWDNGLLGGIRLEQRSLNPQATVK